MDLGKIVSRLSPLGIVFAIVGALLGYLGGRLGKTYRSQMVIKFIGLALCVVAALILLDFI